RQQVTHRSIEGSAVTGVVSGLLGAIGQAGGLVLSKLALRTGLDPLSATVVRVTSATLAVWVMATALGQAPRALRALADLRGTLFMAGGAFSGPFLGVTLSLVAVAHIEAGIAASITAVFPLIAILISARFHGEHLTRRMLAGALVAVAGVVVL